MRIQTNSTAINAHRNYTINNNNITKSVEKLSSGYRINRAGDDAAGLAISEKMRAQIRGLNMASKNSQDAISLVQTAEGALQTTHDILQRMREIATQSASDSNEETVDRAALQLEFDQLMKEIDDTADKTVFNDQKLIDGTFGKTGTTPKAFTVQTGANSGDELAINITAMSSSALGLSNGDTRKANLTAKDLGTTAGQAMVQGTTSQAITTGTHSTGTVSKVVSVNTRDAASNAIKAVNSAINMVSTQRAQLGALQNRLEFKIQNLDISSENLSTAESRIRDVDMAKQMTQFTKQNILSQASTAMLAQANSLPQGVLQLLG